MYKEIWITSCVDDDIEYSFDRNIQSNIIFIIIIRNQNALNSRKLWRKR